MKMKYRTCAILYGQRTGNNWVNRGESKGFLIQGSNIPILAKAQSYKYLGYQIRIDNKRGQTGELLNEFEHIISKVNQSHLHSPGKLEAINTACLT